MYTVWSPDWAQAVEWITEIAPGASLIDPAPKWVDVSEHVRKFGWRRGRQSQTDEYETGGSTTTFKHHERLLDPTNTASPFYPMRPMTPIRHRAVFEGKFWACFRGFVQNWPVRWIDKYTGDVTVNANDPFAFFAHYEMTAAVPFEEAVGARILYLAQNTNWPSGMLDIDVAGNTLVTTHGANTVLGRIREASAASLTPVLFDRRGYLYRGSGRALGYTFSDVVGATLEYMTADVGDNSVDRILNKIKVTGSTGTPQTYTNTASASVITGYGPRLHERTTMHKLDSAALGLATSIGTAYGSPRPRVEFQLNPYKSPDMIRAALTIDLEDNIAFERTNILGGGPNYTVAATDVLSLGHEVEPGKQWTAKYVIDGAAL